MLKKYGKYILGLAIALALLICGWLIWQHFHPPQMATTESQQQAETPEGVQQAAEAAQIPVSPAQAAAVANAIKQAEDEPPAAVVETTGAQLQQIIDNEAKKSGANFAIVTDPKQPDKTVDTKSIPASAPVTLNQYNIHALPGHIWSVDYYNKQTYAAAWQARIGNTGAYIGPSVLRVNDKTYVGARLSGAY